MYIYRHIIYEDTEIPVQSLRVPGVEVVRLSALRSGCVYPPQEISLVIISIRV